MTIRVCHKSFRNIAEKFGLGLYCFIQIAALFIIPLGIMVYSGYFENSECEQLSDGWKEQCYKLKQKYDGTAIIIVGMAFSLMLNLVVPWLSDSRNVWQIINQKLRLFEWREDC